VSTSRVSATGLKVSKGRRSSSRVSPLNLAVKFSITIFVAGQWHIIRIFSPYTRAVWVRRGFLVFDRYASE